MAQTNAHLSRIQEKEVIRALTTSDGRYIPYGGGLMGWFENSGVLECELAQDYKFYSVLKPEEVRSKLFERWQDGEHVNRRASGRKAVARDVTVEISWDGKTATGIVRDSSLHGQCIQVTQQELDLNKGDAAHLRIFERAGLTEPKYEMETRVMWATRSGRDRVVYSVGLMFLDFPRDKAEELRKFLK